METNPAPLEIRLFGTWHAHVNGEPMSRLRSRAGRWLLALLVLRHDCPVERAWLAGTLWPDSDEEQALYNLRRNLTDVRSALGPEAHRMDAPTPRTIRFDTDGADIDLCEFDTSVARGDTGSLERAIEMYRGPLLEGCSEEWVIPERDIREQSYLRALETLGERASERGDPKEAVRHLRRAISIDPFRESLQRALMEALASGGDPAAATQVYRDLRLLLHREMRAAPAPETTSVLERIRGQSKLNAAVQSAVAYPAAVPIRRIPNR